MEPHKLLNAFLADSWLVAMTDYEGRYGAAGTLIGVAALAPASNLKGDGLDVTGGEDGLLRAYQSPFKLPDLAGFYVLFCNGVFAGDPTINPADIFMAAAKTEYNKDFDDKARVELSADPFWKEGQADRRVGAPPGRAGRGTGRRRGLVVSRPRGRRRGRSGR
jgi:hypothetical protein